MRARLLAAHSLRIVLPAPGTESRVLLFANKGPWPDQFGWEGELHIFSGAADGFNIGVAEVIQVMNDLSHQIFGRGGAGSQPDDIHVGQPLGPDVISIVDQVRDHSPAPRHLDKAA